MSGWCLPFLASACFSTAAFAATPLPGKALPPREFTHAHELVEVQAGRRLNVICMGSGSPTVIFEAGGGDDSASFRSVLPAVAATTRACAYDRASIGFSDPTSVPSTAVNTVADLHRLVQKISPDQPVVLVGHSDGGLYVPLYAATYPDDVAGMVLVDPFTVGADRIASDMLTPQQRATWYASDDRDVTNARRCLELAEKGQLRQARYRKSSCLDNPPGKDSARHAVLNEQLARASEQRALLSATLDTYPAPDHGMSGSELALQHADPDFGNTPLVVLTAGKSEQTDLPKGTQEAIAAAWKLNNDRLAARSMRGKNILVPDSHHYIQNEQPRVVIDAIGQVVDEVRDATAEPARK